VCWYPSDYSKAKEIGHLPLIGRPVCGFMTQVRKLLTKFFNIGGMVKIFDDYSVCSVLFELISMIVIVLFEVLYAFSIYVRCRTI
jgi:hypothetical protein